MLWDESFHRAIWSQLLRLRQEREAYFLGICRHKNGQPVVCRWHLRWHKDATESLGSLLALVSQRDIFTQLARHAPLGIALVNSEGRPVFVNDALCNRLGQMASGIAHDVNNALVPVLALAEQLGSHPDSQVRQKAQRILPAGQDMAHLIYRLRSFCSGRPAEDTLESVCLNELIRQCVEWTQPRWRDMAQGQGRTIDIALELDPNLPATAGLPSEIREALVNLILNAVDAIQAKADRNGTISLRSRAEAEHIVVEVSDTGIGMSEETCQRAPEPFFTTKGPQGCALGLPMVYGVMQRHGGHIEIQSVPGTGTTVRLRFPKRSPRQSFHAPAPTLRLTGLHILVVDDDPRVRETLVMMLKALGHRATAAEDGYRHLLSLHATSTTTHFMLS